MAVLHYPLDPYGIGALIAMKLYLKIKKKPLSAISLHGTVKSLQNLWFTTGRWMKIHLISKFRSWIWGTLAKQFNFRLGDFSQWGLLGNATSVSAGYSGATLFC